MKDWNFPGRTAIAGIGATDFSKNSGRSELRLAVEAVSAAILDAGLVPAEVDGLVSFSHDTNPETEVARNVGLADLRFVGASRFGGGGPCAAVQLAVMAVASGVANAVVVYRAFNERSGRRFGAGTLTATESAAVTAEDVTAGWNRPFGLVTPAGWMAMHARRYMHESGASSEDFGRVAVVERRYASNNPAAIFYQRPITLEDHQSSRWIVEPLHLLDCCLENDAAVAALITSVERARDLRNPPAVIEAAAQGSTHEQDHIGTGFYGQSGLPDLEGVAQQLWAMSGLGAEDMQAAILYDHFTPFVLMQLEALGFCERGEARHFVADGNLDLGGRLPTNTNGGQLGEAYVHGVNGILEAARQVRGTAINQVPNLAHIVVAAASGAPGSGLILGRDR
jgi:acetyl-CoA acetyltransferase